MKKFLILVTSGIIVFNTAIAEASTSNTQNSTTDLAFVVKKNDKEKALKKRAKSLRKRKHDLNNQEKMIKKEISLNHKEKKLNKKERRLARKEYKANN